MMESLTGPDYSKLASFNDGEIQEIAEHLK